jgi:hypothetical protein
MKETKRVRKDSRGEAKRQILGEARDALYPGGERVSF